MTREEMEELRQDMLAEARQEEIEEHKLRTDFDYAVETIVSNFELQEAYEQFEKAAKVLTDYGWEMSPLDVFNEL